MPIPVCNTRAVIEDYAEGEVAEIIFDDWGEDGYFAVIDKQRFGEVVGRDMCDYNESGKIKQEDVYEKVDDFLASISEDIANYTIEYIKDNFEGEFRDE